MKEVDAEDLRIDLRTPDAIHWLNDIETGRQYWHWPQTLNMLLQPMFPGQLHRVQRNLYSAVALIDPTNLEGLRCANPLRSGPSTKHAMVLGIPTQLIALQQSLCG